MKIPALTTLLLLASCVVLPARDVYDFTVAPDGSGDFRTVQEAVNAVPDLRKTVTTIFIKRGVYREKITIPGTKTNVRLIGEDVMETVLTFDDHAGVRNRFGEAIGTMASASVFVYGEGFHAEDITFENNAGPAGQVAQAVAVYVVADRSVFINCRFIGNQDTLYTGGDSRQYFRECYIEGTTDFIFGPSTAVFDRCHIHSKKNSYVTAASTPEGKPFGYVFLNCRLTASEAATKVYLGRPWRPFARTVFIRCELGNHIRPEGWHNWNKPDAERTSFYAEYSSFGPGAYTTQRVAWSHQLTSEEVKAYTLETIFNSGEKWWE